MKVVLATKNPGKLAELEQLAADIAELDLVLAPDRFDPIESGNTFIENAVIKAREASAQTKLHAVADDSGIEVYALNRRPGIKSARYCEGSDADRRRKLLQEVLDLKKPNCQAAFVCAMALSAPDGEVLHTVECRWEGVISKEERGANGFGYDPIFYLPEFSKTAAELTAEQKNQVSHRAQAWRAICRFLRSGQL
jgi:XTP/dITP diphosphohydrolase